ncbi:MAG: PepSY domain-containing protein [Burkholderiales bacterium]|nr:PepSY domain-containing protein [Burkholderiales bacterium]
MNNALIRAAALAAVLAWPFAASSAGPSKTQFPKTKVPLERCVAAALEVRAGTIVKMEMKMERGEPVYEFDIESPDGRAWDIECSARTGKIVEVEEEVESPSAPAFAAKMKVSEAEAREIALKRHAGEIVEIEYEIESDGTPVYEIDILTAEGRERKVEVSAVTGEIVEDNEEFYQIGKE